MIVSLFVSQARADTNPSSSVISLSSSGNDAASGTLEAPIRTLQEARKRTHSACRWLLGSGVFEVGDRWKLPSHVTITGQGSQKTTLKGTFLVEDSRDIHFEGLSLRGISTPSPTIYARRASNLSFRKIDVREFNGGCFDLQDVADVVVEDLVSRDTTFNTRLINPKATGIVEYTSVFEVGNVKNLVVQRADVDTRARGGKFLGTALDSWGKAAWNDPCAYLKNIHIQDCLISVDRSHGWVTESGTTVPQAAIEVWHCHNDGIEIDHCSMNGVCSIDGGYHHGEPDCGTLHIHHNLFDHPGYTFEMMQDNSEFDHNYVRGGDYPFAQFGDGLIYSNLNVHHNIFEDIDGPTQIGHFSGIIRGLKFWNNTLVSKSKSQVFFFNKGEPTDALVFNNIFVTGDGAPLHVGVGVMNNWFQGGVRAGEGAQAGYADLGYVGDSAFSRYRPRSKSGLFHGGKIVDGLNENLGSSTGLGAIGLGDQDWPLGPRLAPHL